ncbi:TonB-dependent receptor [Sphingobacterium lumbrici]|uniref:TonB-dependent receptor n=1 Tax=Sphingobacterium lumbrici TaxID=2559600 RepID=UPI00112ADD97|nr:TonB-dependent receptor [Sphingobacterium lumbrici]
MKKLLLFFALILASYVRIQAQVTTSSMTGVVTQSTGHATAGATIKATHLPSGTTYSGSANVAGRFNLANMRVGGPYRIEVTYVGQELIVYEDVYLQLGQPFVLNPIFGDTTTALDEVTVTGRRLKSEKNGASTVVGRQQIDNLPSITRSVNDLTRLTPQANGTAIGGGNYRANNFTVDGANFNNQFGIGQNIPANGSPISIDAIEQISVNVTPFDVRQSGFTGAAINAVTRSGRNEFFGSAFYTGRSDQQQGTRVNDVSTSINDLSVKQYGFSMGGPIVKNKLFFFVNLEQNKTTEPGPTKVASLDGIATGDIARPTADFMTSVANYLRNTYGYDPGAYQGYSSKSNNDKLFARFDWNIAENHKINFRYNQVQGKSPSFLSSSISGSNINTGTYPTNRTGSNALHFGNSNYFQETNLYSGTLEYTGKIGNVYQSLRASYVNQDEPRSFDGQVFPLVDIRDGIFGADGNVLTSFGTDPFTYGNLRSVKTWIANYDVNYTLDNHYFTGGLQFETSRTVNGFQRFGAGYYMFNSWEDFTGDAKPVNYALTFPLTADGSQAFPGFKFNQYSFYLQDEYTVNSKLKLTGGLRLELPTYPDVSEMQTHPMIADLTFANGLQLNTGAMPKARLLVSPRFGFNYDLLGNRSLMVRGGTGVFTGRIPFVWIVAQSSDAGMLQSTVTYAAGDPNMPSFSPDIRANYPATLPEAGTFLPANVSAMDANLKFPSTWKSSLAVDYTLPWGVIGTVEGIYNQDINAVVAKNVNLVEPTAMNISGYGDHRFIYPNANADKYIYNINSGGQIVPSGSAFIPTQMTNAKGGHYYSVTLQLQKNFESGFNGMIAYTGSGAKNYGDGAGDQIQNLWSIPPQSNGNSNNPELSYTSNILPHRLTGVVGYSNNWIRNLKTSMTLFYSGSSMGRYSYTYGSDFNRDGQSNDLIYVPYDPSEITFLPIAGGNSNYGNQAFTAQEQSDAFFALIEGDDYLRSRKGKYAERNGAIAPWRHQFDFRLSQQIVSNITGGNNSLEFFWDVFNIGNLFNSSWGIYKINNNILLTPANTSSIDPNGSTVPTFRMGYANGDIVRELQRPTETISSTYYMQFGLKFSFN